MKKPQLRTPTSRGLSDNACRQAPLLPPWPRVPQLYLMGASVFALTGCELVQGIFKAGFWVGTMIVLAIVGLVLWGVSVFVRR